VWPRPSVNQKRLPGTPHLIAVGSGKGGIGVLDPMPEPQAHGG